MRFRIFHHDARSILSETSGFIAQAGFTHSLTPARNCTYACTYCYVPTMRVHGGLRAEDWQRWGQFTTFKSNAAELLRKALRGRQSIYCSPLVDPYQPAETTEVLMRRILEVLIDCPPRVFAIQTRGPLILRDLDLLRVLRDRTLLRVSFSITTNREDIRRLYEPHCEPNSERLEVIRELTSAGIETFATLAPLLPCDPEELADAAMAVTPCDLIGDPLHVRAVKRSGATTREAAGRIAELHGHQAWFDPEFQFTIVERLQRIAAQKGRRFAAGPEGFSWLSQT
jgi:DNA repair photolyase